MTTTSEGKPTSLLFIFSIQGTMFFLNKAHNSVAQVKRQGWSKRLHVSSCFNVATFVASMINFCMSEVSKESDAP